jgi:hypothetical protein
MWQARRISEAEENLKTLETVVDLDHMWSKTDYPCICPKTLVNHKIPQEDGLVTSSKCQAGQHCSEGLQTEPQLNLHALPIELNTWLFH